MKKDTLFLHGITPKRSVSRVLVQVPPPMVGPLATTILDSAKGSIDNQGNIDLSIAKISGNKKLYKVDLNNVSGNVALKPLTGGKDGDDLDVVFQQGATPSQITFPPSLMFRRTATKQLTQTAQAVDRLLCSYFENGHWLCELQNDYAIVFAVAVLFHDTFDGFPDFLANHTPEVGGPWDFYTTGGNYGSNPVPGIASGHLMFDPADFPQPVQFGANYNTPKFGDLTEIDAKLTFRIPSSPNGERFWADFTFYIGGDRDNSDAPDLSSIQLYLAYDSYADGNGFTIDSTVYDVNENYSSPFSYQGDLGSVLDAPLEFDVDYPMRLHLKDGVFAWYINGQLLYQGTYGWMPKNSKVTIVNTVEMGSIRGFEFDEIIVEGAGAGTIVVPGDTSPADYIDVSSLPYTTDTLDMPSGKVQWYRINLLTDGPIVVDAMQSDPAADSSVALFDDQGNLIGENDDNDNIDGTYRSYLAVQTQPAGYYWVAVSSYPAKYSAPWKVVAGTGAGAPVIVTISAPVAQVNYMLDTFEGSGKLNAHIGEKIAIWVIDMADNLTNGSLMDDLRLGWSSGNSYLYGVQGDSYLYGVGPRDYSATIRPAYQPAVEEFALEVEFVMGTSGDVRVGWARDPSQNKHYELVINSVPGHNQVALIRQDPDMGGPQDLGAWQAWGAVGLDASKNVLRIENRNGNIQVFLNGTKTHDVTEETSLPAANHPVFLAFSNTKGDTWVKLTRFEIADLDYTPPSAVTINADVIVNGNSTSLDPLSVLNDGQFESVQFSANEVVTWQVLDGGDMSAIDTDGLFVTDAETLAAGYSRMRICATSTATGARSYFTLWVRKVGEQSIFEDDLGFYNDIGPEANMTLDNHAPDTSLSSGWRIESRDDSGLPVLDTIVNGAVANGVNDGSITDRLPTVYVANLNPPDAIQQEMGYDELKLQFVASVGSDFSDTGVKELLTLGIRSFDPAVISRSDGTGNWPQVHAQLKLEGAPGGINFTFTDKTWDVDAQAFVPYYDMPAQGFVALGQSNMQPFNLHIGQNGITLTIGYDETNPDTVLATIPLVGAVRKFKLDEVTVAMNRKDLDLDNVSITGVIFEQPPPPPPLMA